MWRRRNEDDIGELLMRALRGESESRRGVTVTLEIRVAGIEELIEALRELRDAVARCSRQQ